MRSEQFERLYGELAPGLLAFLVYRTGDRGLSEDILADTFERVLTASRGFDRLLASEKTWVYTIALNLLRDHARRDIAAQKALQHVAARTPEAVEPDLDDIMHRELVQRALSILSSEEREAIALRFGADLSVPEIAKVLGQKLSTVEGRVYRALRKLKDHVGPEIA